jgi:3-hydroxy-3-methylglutaryl CoA synthase
MSLLGITSCGAYIPRLRLSRKVMAQANAWALPSLRAAGKGERAICNWDEDSLTLAVEASRDALVGVDRTSVAAAYLASTSLPFIERQNAGLLAAALRLPKSTATLDIGGSQRAATSILANAVALKSRGSVLIAAADHRRAKPGSAQEFQWGDAGAALLLGTGPAVARCLGAHSLTDDFVDHYRTEEQPYDYGWEERWVRDEGYGKLVPEAVHTLLGQLGADASNIAHFIMPSAFGGLAAAMARKLGIPEQAVTDDMSARVGDSGVAHPLLMLASVLQHGRAGERILVVGFGQGCDVLLFEATGPAGATAARNAVDGALARGRTDDNYLRFLSFNRELDIEWGKRAEIDNRTALSAQYRLSDMVLGFVGGRCKVTGTVEFPRSRISVFPGARNIDTQEDLPLAEEPAKIMSFTEDWLSFKESPPFRYGQVQFDCGARLIMEFADSDSGQLEVGMPLKMAFRIKDFDHRRGYRRYFWKAVPAANWAQV